MTIEALLRVIPPPAAPAEAFDGPWGPTEAALGLVLPQDYKDLVRLYGSGYWAEWLVIDLPRSANPNIQLVPSVKQTVAAFRENGAELPYPLWPAAEGLLPFGVTDDGDSLFWLTRGDPASWPVVIWSRGFHDWEVFEHDLTGWLAAIATGDLVPRCFPEDLAKSIPFQPNPAAEPGPREIRPAKPRATLDVDVSWSAWRGTRR